MVLSTVSPYNKRVYVLIENSINKDRITEQMQEFFLNGVTYLISILFKTALP